MIAVGPDEERANSVALASEDQLFEHRRAQSLATDLGGDHEFCFGKSRESNGALIDDQHCALAGGEFHEAAVGERRLSVGSTGALDEARKPGDLPFNQGVNGAKRRASHCC